MKEIFWISLRASLWRQLVEHRCWVWKLKLATSKWENTLTRLSFLRVHSIPSNTILCKISFKSLSFVEAITTLSKFMSLERKFWIINKVNRGFPSMQLSPTQFYKICDLKFLPILLDSLNHHQNHLD